MVGDQKPKRIGSLDLIRGVAICGLVPINMLDFAGPDDWVFSPVDLKGRELRFWILVSVFGMGKFVSLFSILFGASMILQTRDKEGQDISVARSYLPRLGWLWVFGMIHGYLIWWGDILVGYAVTGFVVFWCRSWSARALGIVGVGIHLLATLIITAIICVILLSGNGEFFESEWSSDEELAFWDSSVFSESWLDQMPLRAAVTALMHVIGIPFLIFPFCGSLMLVGMALLKSGFFEHKWRPNTYRRVLRWCLVSGLGLAVAGVALSYQGGWTSLSIFKYSPLGILATPFIAMGYAIILLLWSQKSWMDWLQAGFKSVGRMAFSNYIGQSIIFTLIFYGTGFGFYGKLDFSTVMMICPAVWIFQMVVSVIWLRRFRFGPLERLWRRLASGRRV